MPNFKVFFSDGRILSLTDVKMPSYSAEYAAFSKGNDYVAVVSFRDVSAVVQEDHLGGVEEPTVAGG